MQIIKEGQCSVKEIFEQCKLFSVPIYQRNYSWKKRECETLLKDIEEDSGHFTGSIVLYKNGERYSIIDGQQRLTTITLLMIAIKDSLEEFGQKDEALDLHKKYLVVNQEHAIERLQGKDKNREYIKTIIINKNAEITDCNAHQNYKFFKEKIDCNNIKKIYKNLTQLKLVLIILNQDQNPQKIFESLNNTGVKLKESELIRNFLFMKIESDRDVKFGEEIMNDYWSPIELYIGEENLDMFFRHFLSYKAATEDCKVKTYRGTEFKNSKINKLIGEFNIYDNFKYLYQDVLKNEKDAKFDKENTRKIMEEIKLKAKLYSIILGKESNTNSPKVIAAIKNLVFLEQKTIYPLLLHIINENYGKSKEKECLEALEILEIYIFRSIVTNSSKLKQLGNDVIKILQKLSKIDLRETVIEVLKNNYPKDEDIKTKFLANNFYKGVLQPHEIYYLFLRMDNKNQNVENKLCDWHKTNSNKTGFTVEHIFPKKDKDAWSENEKEKWLNKKRETWLFNLDFQYMYNLRHSIGNLIITDRNYEAGTSPLKEKYEKYNKGKMFCENKIFVDKLISNNNYSEEDIKKRNEDLYNEFIKLWRWKNA